MGGLAGIVRWDDAPIEAADLDRMIRASAHRAPDGARVHTSARAALAHLRFTTVPVTGDEGPLVDPVRGLAVVFDGRLDNRSDLLRLLDVPAPASDAQLALEAVARWDVEAPAHLVGDFAFIVWDDRRRRVLAARDHLGVRHLHYCWRAGLLVCATDLSQVLSHPAVPRDPDPSVAADYLAIDIRNGPATLYKNVCRVPPGHVLVGDARGVRLDRYWSAEPRAPIRYARDADYAAHCRDLLVTSVAARLRSDRPVAAMLSGGLDSSSVVSIAHRVVRDGSIPPRPFSMVYPDHPESDERPFIDAVARHCGTAAVHVRPGPVTAAALHRQVGAWTDAPSMPADEMAATLYAQMQAHGHRATLTGAGGDFLFTGSVFQYADLLRRFRIVAAVRRYIDDGRADDTGRSRFGLLQAGVWPLLPAALKRCLRPLARRMVGIEEQPPWLRIPRAPDVFPDAPRGGSYATEEVTRLLGGGMHSFFLETAERAAAFAGIELRHPLLDVRLVEFALDIPDDQRKRGPHTKFVLRAALGDDLAEPVRTRRTKGDFAHAVVEAIESLGGERFYSRLSIAEAGWVRGDLVARRYRQMRAAYGAGPDAYGAYVPELWMIAAVELWFRSAVGAPPTVAGAVY